MPSSEPITIIDVLGISDQGATAPYLCEASDNRRYYVKGWGAGVRSLLCEWVAGHLGKALGLPIPEFSVLHVPPCLARNHQGGLDLRSLGSGPVFGSLIVENCEEFRLDRRDQVPRQIQIDILMFDFWVRNADRTLSPYGGNPNLLWELASSELRVIDHNLAFDVKFDHQTFWESHVFADLRQEIWRDPAVRDEWRQKLTQLLCISVSSWSNAPAEWIEANQALSGAGRFDRADVLSILESCKSSEFWS